MPLAKPERDVLERLKAQWESAGTADEGMLRYYQGRQRLEQIGLTIPPSLRRFVVVANWPRVVVDTIVKVVEPPITSSVFMMDRIPASLSSRWLRGAEA